MIKEETRRTHTPSMENYLETIATLRNEDRIVRVSQISQRLKVKMPSVTAALKRLSQQGLVEHERYGYIKLTPKGDKVAREVIRRHKALSCFFAKALDIDQKTAEEDACKIEHIISPLSMERIVKFVEFLQACPLGEANLSGRYKYYLEHEKLPEECLRKDTLKRWERQNF